MKNKINITKLYIILSIFLLLFLMIKIVNINNDNIKLKEINKRNIITHTKIIDDYLNIKEENDLMLDEIIRLEEENKILGSYIANDELEK
tara:strand:+ start:2929 stop:3198 length:270 start_codon:yes stop_codon:yes gene_type:complete